MSVLFGATGGKRRLKDALERNYGLFIASIYSLNSFLIRESSG
jgi:hypothetical protein